MTINEKNTSIPEGATHFLRYESGCIAWYKVAEENGLPLISEWDEFNKYWVICVHVLPHYELLGLAKIGGTQDAAEPAAQPGEAPTGATHRYEHGGLISWYRETTDNLFVWRDGSWHGAAYKTTGDLVKNCIMGKLTLLAMEQTEPAEDDLTWLARNVHKWPESMKAVMNPARFVLDVMPSELHFTESQWLTRRAELQNKPSWADAPEWALYLVQNCIGLWTFTRFEPRPNPAGGWSLDRDVQRPENRLCVNIKDEVGGEVLGDWRNTLELRPADLSEPAVTERMDEAIQIVLAAVPGLMDEEFKVELESPSDFGHDFFKGVGTGTIDKFMASVRETPVALSSALSSEELADLHDLCDAELTKRDAAVCGGQKYLDATWHERGELPPVGIECEYVSPMSGAVKAAFIVARHHFSEQVIWSTRQSGGELFYGQKGCFRPIRTEREQLVDVLSNAGIGSYALIAADAILVAGFKRDGGAA